MYLFSYFTTEIRPSPAAHTLAAAFGLYPREFRFPLAENLHINVRPGQILFLTGPSGSGKTALLTILRQHLTPNLDIIDISLPPNKILPDHFNLPLEKALYFLSLTGLADAFLFLRTPPELSDGQLFRFKLALTLAKSPPYIFCDNFLDPLDRLSAKILAANLRKFAFRSSSSFIFASPHHDFLPQLKPDILIEKPYAAPAISKSFHRRRKS
jgi:hypothetical protein